jgi:tape measure domain-containing protein
MSSSVDDRVVKLSFDNKQFEQASAQSMSTMDKLKKSLDFNAANKSLGGLQKTAGGFTLGNLGTTIEGISTKFLTMGTIGVTALVQITQQAIATGEQMLKALTIDPVKTGFNEYSTNLNSIQTILSNTMSAGTNLKDVNKALAELNEYSDKTIYNFSEMARNIGTFTAAGVGLKPATAAIKGIANLAALSGSNSQQAATAMYQLSQAISSGTVKLMDWNSVTNAGMGGTVFQRALANTAVQMGKLNDSAVKLTGPMKTVTIAGLKFRDSLSQGANADWLTSDVLTKTLAQFTGDLTDAQLAAEGWSKAEIKAIQAQAKAAQDAATQVKTIQQAFDVAKETAGSGWAKSWQIIFGDFGQAKKDMTALSEFINGIINKNAEKRNKILSEWNKAGGRTAGIQALKAAFEALDSVMKPIKQAWENVFPASSGKDLAALTKTVRDFFRGLILGPETMAKIRTAFQGFFSILKIGKNILVGAFNFFKDIFGLFANSGGKAGEGILDVAASIGEALTNFERFLNGTNAVPAFFNRLYNAVGPTVVKIRDFVNAIRDVLGSGIATVVENLFDMGKAATTANADGISPLASAWEKFLGFFKGAGDIIGQVATAIKDAFTGFKDGGLPDITGTIMENLQKIDWVNVFKATVGAGFVAGVGLSIKAVWEFIQGIKTMFELGGNISGAFEQLKDTLKSYQKEIQVRTLLMIAAAILALAIAVKILSTISTEDLLVSIAAIYILFEMLDTAMSSLAKIGDSKGIGKIPVIAASLFLIAGAMIVFALALKLLGSLDWDQSVQGLKLMGIIVGGLIVTAKLLEKAQGDVLKFSAALLILSYAMIVFAGAIFLYSKMDWETFGKGAVMIGLLVAGIGIALRLMPKNGTLLASAAALILIAVAMNMLIIPIKVLGEMDFEMLKQGIGAVAVMLLVLAIALNAMNGTLTGAAAMIIASAALYIFAGAMQTLATIGFGSIVLGILGIVIAMAAIAGAAFLLAPAAIPMAIFGAALVVLGAGFFLLGGGALAFAAAMSIIITIMSLGMPILEDTIRNFIKLIPLLADGFQTFLEEFSNAFAEAVPEMVNAVEVLITEILNAIERMIPEIVDIGTALFRAFIESIVAQANILYDAAWSLLTGFLNTIDSHLPSVIEDGKGIILTLIDGMGKAAKEIAIQAGETMLDFLEGITKWLNDNEDRIGQAGKDLGGAIISGFISAMTGGLANDAFASVSSFFGNIIDTAKGVLDSNSPSKVFIKIGKDVTKGFVIGIASGRQDVIDSISYIRDVIKDARQDAIDNIKDLKAKLKDLKEDPRTEANKKAIAKAEKALAVAEANKKRLDKAWETVSKQHKKQFEELKKLGSQFDSVTKKLEAARDKLDELKAVRNDYAKSVIDQYGDLPELNKDTTLDEYYDNIRNATEANIKFKATMDKLRELGLNDSQYKEFMAAGTDIQPFLDNLLLAGGAAVDELNAIDISLQESATSLGNGAADALYKAGIDIAQGLVDGLETQLASITEKMKSIGKAIADEIKKELGIQSPSKVMKSIGKFIVVGLRDGIDKNSNVIDISARRLGENAVDALKESLSGLSDAVNSDVDLTPTIAPVLDLDAFRKDAAGINDILAPSAIAPSTSTTVANDISNETARRELLLKEQALAATGTTIEFTQNNTSPVALSSAEIYRQTRNQLSVVKGALKN